MAKKQWYSIGEWDQPLLFTSIESEFSTGKYHRILSPHLASGFRVVSGHFYFETAMYRQIKTLVERTNYVNGVIHYHKVAFRNIRDYIRRHSPARITNDAEALRLFELFVQASRDIAYFMDTNLMIDDVILQKILKQVDFTTAAHLVKVKKLTDINREIRSLNRISLKLQKKFGMKFLANGPIAILSILKNKRGNEALLKQLNEHATQFSYLPMQTFRGQPWDLRDYIVRAQEMVRKNHSSQTGPTLIVPKLDKTTKRLIDQARQLNELRGERIEQLNKWIWKMDALWKYFETKLHLEHEEFISMSYQEVLQAIKTGRLPVAKKELRLRNKSYSCLWLNGRFTYHSSLPTILKQQTMTAVRGFTAYPGKVTGNARVIRGVNDFKKFKPKDILVAPLTTPNFVVVMSKSAAIVTDVGGITSHAAVVSRELHKPCIVGTKIATQVFRDGDLIEVDADKGIATKLNK